MHLMEVAAELDVSPSTAHRTLAMLVYRGFATQDDSHIYFPGPAIGERPLQTDDSARLRKLIQPYLSSLAERTGESVHLEIRVEANVRVLSTAESTQPVRIGDRRGSVFPANAAAGGKVLLAELAQADLARLYLPVPAELPDAMRGQFETLLQRLDKVRERGFGVNLQETETGVCAVGIAIHYRGMAVAALVVTLPPSRMPESLRSGLIVKLFGERLEIEKVLAAVS